jgi:hypothetical protein
MPGRLIRSTTRRNASARVAYPVGGQMLAAAERVAMSPWNA